MKKILFLLALTATMFVAQAQVVNLQLKSQYSATVDTITSAVKYLTSTDLGLGGFASFTIAANYEEISGTTAGTAKVQYSIDGTVYKELPSDSVFTAVDAATNAYIWMPNMHNKRLFRYVRVAFTPTGTMSDKVYARFTGIR